MAKRQPWISVLIATAAVAGFLSILTVGGSMYWLYQHVETRELSSESAASEFRRERARFAGQLALIEMRPDADPIVRPAAEVSNNNPITTLHVLGYDPDKERLIRASVPFWLLRIAPESSFSLTSEDSVIFGRLRLSADDIERRGAGLVLDMEDIPVRGVRALAWAD